MHANDVALALQAGPPGSIGEVEARLAALRDELGDAMVGYGLGRLGAVGYARRARRLTEARAALARLRARFA